MTAPLELELLEPELDDVLPEDVDPLDEVEPLPVEVLPLVPEVDPLAGVDPELVPVLLLVEPVPLVPDELEPDELLPEDVLLELPVPEVDPPDAVPPADLLGVLDAVGAALEPEAELVPEPEVEVPAEDPAAVAPPPVLPPEAGIAVNPVEVWALEPAAKATPRTPRLATVTTLLVRFLTRQTPRREFGGPGFRHG